MEYIVKLTDFEGPLDLLLHLIEKAKVDIKDIFVSEITEQYLSYVDEMKELDMEVASEFLSVAATLLLIKSRSLLPRPEPLEETDPEMMLIRQIEEYKLFKDASEKLKTFEAQAGRAYYKLPEEYPFSPPQIELDNVSTEMLVEAFLQVYRRSREAEKQETPQRQIIRDIYTVSNRISHMKRLISQRPVMGFEEFFSENVTKPEVVCVFAAMLELLASKYIRVEQRKTFGDIIIKRVGA